MLIYFIYRLLGVFAFPLILLYILVRGLHDRRYWHGIGERFGGPPLIWNPTVPGGIWLHAVSVGEIVSAIELLRQLKLEFPAQPIFVSVTTVAGREVAEQKLQHLVDAILYAPIDLCWTVRRVLRRFKPQVVVVMETEIWPNLYREARRFGCGLLVINGRISDRAFPRYQNLRWFFQGVLRWPNAILVQNEIAAARYAATGAPPDRVFINGNLKYDFRVDGLEPPPAVVAFCKRANPQAIWIAASTMPPALDGDPDEDDAVIAALHLLAPQHPRLLLVLVPRRPERFEEAARKLAASGVPFVRRSQISESAALQLPAVLLLDSVGELVSLFPLATVVFVGGTLPQRGGHNILEPAFFSKPVIIGPHMENFPDIAAEFRAEEAVKTIDTPGELAVAVDLLLRDPELRRAIGERAKRLAESRRGATTRSVAALRECYQRALPRHIEPLWVRIMTWPLARIWAFVTASDRRRKMFVQRRLQAPVISVGGIAMGGSGKTPLVAFLAERLDQSGLRVGILTRGYRRSSPEPHTILSPGESCSTARTGDEAQIFLRAGHAALGIGANRYEAGLMLQKKFHTDLFLLDDGFQHWRLGRTGDIVVLDALRPFAGGDVFPAGSLREPLRNLRRASAFVVSRANMPIPWIALEEALHRIQPNAPVFYNRLLPIEWVRVAGSETLPAEAFSGEDTGAFCGLGNPASFYGTLAHLGIHPRFQWSFDDHFSYKPKELWRLAALAREAGARVLLTTEKDLMNLPPDAERHASGMPLYWLRTSLAFDHEERFLQWIMEILGRRSVSRVG